MYQYFIEFCGIPEELFEASPAIQKACVACSMGLAVIGFALISYTLIVIFRGWK